MQIENECSVRWTVIYWSAATAAAAMTWCYCSNFSHYKLNFLHDLTLSLNISPSHMENGYSSLSKREINLLYWKSEITFYTLLTSNCILKPSACLFFYLGDKVSCTRCNTRCNKWRIPMACLRSVTMTNDCLLQQRP